MPARSGFSRRRNPYLAPLPYREGAPKELRFPGDFILTVNKHHPSSPDAASLKHMAPSEVLVRPVLVALAKKWRMHAASPELRKRAELCMEAIRQA